MSEQPVSAQIVGAEGTFNGKLFSLIPGCYCRDCKWWDSMDGFMGNDCHGDTNVRYCVCRRWAEDDSKVLHYEWNYNGTRVNTAPDFGCCQGETK